jgi:hypothetical protein
MRLLVAFPVLVSLSLVAPRSVADDQAPIGWSVEVEAAEGSEPICNRERLVREVELACDALGKTCVVAEQNATRHAILRCARAWLIEARDVAGALLWTMPIDGEGDRIRQAAMWIARDSSEARLAAALPEHAIQDDATPARAPEMPPVPPPAPAAVATSSPALQRPGGVFAAARAGLAGAAFRPTFGGRIAAALALLSPDLALDVSLAAAGTLAGSTTDAYTSARIGGGVAYGAPWATARWGVSVEGGAVALIDESAQGPWLSANRSAVSPYGELAVTTQWYAASAVRPFVTLSGSYQQAPSLGGLPSATFPSFTAALDLGVAWRSW